MLVTGWKSPGTLASVDRDGKVAWVNPGNAAASDGTFATCDVVGGTYGDWLRLTNFGFASPADIPAGQTISGIEVSIERKGGSFLNVGIYDSAIYLRKTAGQVGADKSSLLNWPRSVDAIWIYGAATDLWGTTWTIADIVSADFGIDISAKNILATDTASIDHVQIRVYYGVIGAQMML